MDGYDDWLISQKRKDQCVEEKIPITLTPVVKQAVIDTLLKYGPNLYQAAQQAAPDDVDVDEHEFAAFMWDVHAVLERLV
jgi:hypothetical protein